MKKEAKAPDPQKVFPNVKDRIVYAFTLEGTHYYEFYDFNNVPCVRGFYSFTFFNELKMRCTREYLIAHNQALKEAFAITNGKLDLNKPGVLINQMQERLDFVFEPNIAYKLATVVYFDATENPYEYDMKYALEKAKKFRTAPLEAFFLSTPIGKLMPFMQKLGSDLPTYFETIQEVNLKHLENLFTMLSSANTNSDWYKSLTSQMNEISAQAKLNK